MLLPVALLAVPCFIVAPTRGHAWTSCRAGVGARMDFLSKLPGFWTSKCPDGYVRASHILFLGTEEDADTRASALLERIRSGTISFAKAAELFSWCPTRSQVPAGDLGTFSSLSCMATVDEMRSFEGRLELPYENQDTTPFDEAVFAAPLLDVQTCRSAWGVHLILVTDRGNGPPAVRAPTGAPPVVLGDLKTRSQDAGKSM